MHWAAVGFPRRAKGASHAEGCLECDGHRQSDDIEVVDGYTYFPVEAVDHRYLQASGRRSVCPWKGTASYYDIVVDGALNPAAAWLPGAQPPAEWRPLWRLCCLVLSGADVLSG
ncbi:MAG: DUF427 domain-containing protein [Acidimicrobiales bacterium]